MAIVKVKNSRNGEASINYVLDDKEGVNDLDNPRYLIKSGVNLDDEHALSEMEDVWKTYNKNGDNNVKTYNIIQAFSEDDFNADSEEDRQKANDIGATLGEELYPGRQVLVVTQADGDAGLLHNHIIVNSVSYIDGYSISDDEASWITIANKSDEIIQREPYNLTPYKMSEQRKEERARNTVTSKERDMQERGRYVWKDDLKERIERGLDDINVIDEESFINKMNQLQSDDEESQKVDVIYRSGGVRFDMIDTSKKDKDGNIIPKQRKARGSTLGTDFMKENLQATFEVNAEKLELENKQVEPVEEVEENFEDTIDNFNNNHDFDAELNKIRRREPIGRVEDVEPTIEYKQRVKERDDAERSDKRHSDALIMNERYDFITVDNAHADAFIINDDIDAKRKEEKERKQFKEAEQRRIEELQQVELEAREKAESDRREYYTIRIQNARVFKNSDAVSDRAINSFIATEKEMKIKGLKKANSRDYSPSDYDLNRISEDNMRHEDKAIEQQPERELQQQDEHELE